MCCATLLLQVYLPFLSFPILLTPALLASNIHTGTVEEDLKINRLLKVVAIESQSKSKS